jgi:hypothetical protein
MYAATKFANPASTTPCPSLAASPHGSPTSFDSLMEDRAMWETKRTAVSDFRFACDAVAVEGYQEDDGKSFAELSHVPLRYLRITSNFSGLAVLSFGFWHV